METHDQLTRNYESYFSIFSILVLGIYIAITAAVAATGKRKGLEYWPVFIFSFFATPIAGLLYVIANLQQGAGSFPASSIFQQIEEAATEAAPAENEEVAVIETHKNEPDFAVKKGKWDVF